ncbi:MaoC family dehydratase [Arenibaculum sp.]|jgi:acyl dehydratase|uniref:MaoC family dehydratase n=1 Tax=Arenibaculum sp. TaxID=2865862 RepID=UPI002E126591|nr:MaoC family dehydratase [Arenibaculum sp.]
MQQRYFEDFRAGDRFETPGTTLTEAQIVDFALTYDPQPFHRDKVAAENSLYGGLIASGFQTMALVFRLFMDTGVLAACNLGGTAGEMRWLRPVRPGDTLRVAVEVVSVEPSRSREDRGRIRFAYTGLNQDGEPVLTMTLDHIVARRRPETPDA